MSNAAFLVIKQCNSAVATFKRLRESRIYLFARAIKIDWILVKRIRINLQRFIVTTDLFLQKDLYILD